MSEAPLYRTFGLSRSVDTGRPSSSPLLLSSLELSDAKVYEPYIRAILGTASHFCEVVPVSASPLAK